MEEQIDAIAWKNADLEDLWIFDKLIVSRKLGYVCGPVGSIVPKPDEYIVRPCVNILGMGLGAQFIFIKDDTEHLPYGHFWCEVFKGRHLSIDYKDGKQILAVEGFKDNVYNITRFSKWKKVDDIIPIPSIFYYLTKKYEYINIEFLDGNPIEIHLRHNPDFRHGNLVAIPVWNDQEINPPENFKFIEDKDYKRKGFYID